MMSKETSGVVLSKVPEKEEYVWSDPDFPDGDRSLEFTFRPGITGPVFNHVIASHGSIDRIFQLDVRSAGAPYIERDNMLFLLSSELKGYQGMVPEATIEDLTEFARSHPLCSGISVHIAGRQFELCSRITDEEIKAEIEDLFESKAISDLLHELPELGRDPDNNTRFLVAEAASDKEKLSRRYSIPSADDMDLVIEVAVSQDPAGKDAALNPECLFHLSKSPRFDYETGALSGVGECYDIHGEKTSHKDIWAARAIMQRLPAEDIDYEDARHYIDKALIELADGTPTPAL